MRAREGREGVESAARAALCSCERFDRVKKAAIALAALAQRCNGVAKRGDQLRASAIGVGPRLGSYLYVAFRRCPRHLRSHRGASRWDREAAAVPSSFSPPGGPTSSRLRAAFAAVADLHAARHRTICCAVDCGRGSTWCSGSNGRTRDSSRTRSDGMPCCKVVRLSSTAGPATRARRSGSTRHSGANVATTQASTERAGAAVPPGFALRSLRLSAWAHCNPGRAPSRLSSQATSAAVTRRFPSDTASRLQ